MQEYGEINQNERARKRDNERTGHRVEDEFGQNGNVHQTDEKHHQSGHVLVKNSGSSGIQFVQPEHGKYNRSRENDQGDANRVVGRVVSERHAAQGTLCNIDALAQRDNINGHNGGKSSEMAQKYGYQSIYMHFVIHGHGLCNQLRFGHAVEKCTVIVGGHHRRRCDIGASGRKVVLRAKRVHVEEKKQADAKRVHNRRVVERENDEGRTKHVQ